MARQLIDAELLHRAADAVGQQQEPEDGGFSPRAIQEFYDQSDFTIEGQRVGVDAGSLALGIAIGVEAARLVESEQQGGAAR